MSKVALDWFKHQRIGDATLKAVVRAIAWSADKGGGECRAAQSVLAAEASTTDRAVRAALVVLERLEIIRRKPRSKGKYGRTTDLIMLALDRHFDVSKASVRAIRKSLRPALQPERRSGKTETCNRNRVPLQPEPRSGEYNPVYPEVPYQVRISTNVEGSSTGGETNPTDRAAYPANVIPLMSRGVA
ncbi:hypothetical protein J2X35_003233 [Mesorhizobium sp. BE184]|nr:hypothetical protein [Mesorhizobium sp. BE184]